MLLIVKNKESIIIYSEGGKAAKNSGATLQLSTSPPVILNIIDRPKESTARCIVVLSPATERPM